ncbi:ABC transporter permease [Ilumatobacter sp.]|uniref:ABC transporter permease n=1 Tax=Ilumatobacter sp. TaxID=1967498 RepID=UPI003751617D
MKIDESTGDVTHRPVLKKNKVTRRHTVTNERIDRTKKIDSRFDTRRSPIKWKMFHPRNIGVVYLYALIWAVFMTWVPETWFTWLTHRSVLNANAILVVVALGLLVPLAAGVFDLSIAGTISASSVVAGWGMVEQGWSYPVAIAAALLVGVVVGNVNGFLVVKIRIDSFIATLGMSSILTAFAVWRSNNRSILGFPDSFKSLATEFAWGLNKTVILAIVLAFALWFIVEHTAVGRYLFATGGAREAARLAGVQTDRYVWGSLVTSAVFAAIGGVMLAAQFGSTQAQSGSPYLLPAFAAAFLGSTQFKRRFNVWGAVLAVFVLQSGVKGLQLAGVGTTWIEALFFGVALIVAVGFSSYRKSVHGGERRWWRREESGPEHFLGKLLGWGTPKTDRSKENVQEWWYDPEDAEGHHIKPK